MPKEVPPEDRYLKRAGDRPLQIRLTVPDKDPTHKSQRLTIPTRTRDLVAARRMRDAAERAVRQGEIDKRTIAAQAEKAR